MAACAIERPMNELHLLMLDLGSTLAEAEDQGERLREVVSRSRARFGGLATLMWLAERQGVDATLRLASGQARTSWRANRVRYTDGAHVPGLSPPSVSACDDAIARMTSRGSVVCGSVPQSLVPRDRIQLCH